MTIQDLIDALERFPGKRMADVRVRLSGAAGLAEITHVDLDDDGHVVIETDDPVPA